MVNSSIKTSTNSSTKRPVFDFRLPSGRLRIPAVFQIFWLFIGLMNIANEEAKMEVQGPDRLLEEDELALAIAFSADAVLIILQEVNHAGIGNPGLLGNVDLRKALRGRL